MQDYLNHSEKLRKDAAECGLIGDLATDAAKREWFDRLPSHLTILADQGLARNAQAERMNG